MTSSFSKTPFILGPDHAIKPVTVHFRPLIFPCDHHSVIHPPYTLLLSSFFKEPKNQFQGINSASLCSLAGRYDNPIRCRYKVPNIKVPNHKIPNNKVPNTEIPK